MLQKVTVFAVLIALILALFPTSGALAGTGLQANQLEQQWDKYVQNVEKMAVAHDKIDAKANKWLTQKKHSQFKTQIANHLSVYHSNLDAANAIINTHDGFDSNGKITKLSVANETVNHLGFHLSVLRPAWHELTNLDQHFTHN
jgi:hypothetical protein